MTSLTRLLSRKPLLRANRFAPKERIAAYRKVASRQCSAEKNFTPSSAALGPWIVDAGVSSSTEKNAVPDALQRKKGSESQEQLGRTPSAERSKTPSLKYKAKSRLQF